MEECNLLADARKPVEGEEMCAWKTRHIHKKPEKKKKGPVEPEKENEMESLELLFCHIHKFHNPVPNAAPVFVPAALPPRYAISFIPAGHSASAPPSVSSISSSPSADFPIVSSSARSVTSDVSFARSVPSTVYSVVSSANFDVPVLDAPVITHSCIGQTQ